jgi:Tfp pilus assembly protein PilE
MSRRFQQLRASEAGASVLEIMIVMAIILILSSVAIPYMWNYKKLYKSEDQSLRMMDLMREAAQTALVKRRTIRYEIDLTDNAVLLIDESQNAPKGQQLKKIPLELTRDVRVDAIPTGISKPNPPNYADAAFATDNVGHMIGATTITGHNIWSCRFKSDGSVVNSAGNPISANIYVWPPQTTGSLTPRNTAEVRAITIFGGTGAVRYWKYTGSAFTAYQ